MADISHELLNSLAALDQDAQEKVLAFIRELKLAPKPDVALAPTTSRVEGTQPYTEDELDELLRPRRKTVQEVIAWLNEHPMEEEWGGMKPEGRPR